MNLRAGWLFCAFAVCACGGPTKGTHSPPSEPRGKQVVVSPWADASEGKAELDVDVRAEDAPPPPRDGNVDFAVRKAPPNQLRFDADLREWGPLVPDSEAALSHVSLSFSADSLVVAGDVVSREGIWLDIAFPHNAFPTPSEYDHGSGSMIPLECNVVIPSPNAYPKGGRTGFHEYKVGVVASAQTDCRRLMDRVEAMRRTYESSFRRSYRIDAAGVRWLDDSGALAPVAEASRGFALRDGRVQFEVGIPYLALPQAAETPLRSVMLGVSDAPASSPPARAFDQLTEVPLDEVRLEPGAAVRELFSDYPSLSPFAMAAHSYQPGDGLTFDEYALCQEEGLPSVCHRSGSILRSGGRALGMIEILPGDRGNIVMVNGKPAQAVFGTIVARPDSIHVYSHNLSFDVDGDLKYHACWSVAMFDAEGHMRETVLPALTCDPDSTNANCCIPAVPKKKGQCKPTPFHNADYSELGFRGRGWREDGTLTSEVRSSWEATKGEFR